MDKSNSNILLLIIIIIIVVIAIIYFLNKNNQQPMAEGFYNGMNNWQSDATRTGNNWQSDFNVIDNNQNVINNNGYGNNGYGNGYGDNIEPSLNISEIYDEVPIKQTNCRRNSPINYDNDQSIGACDPCASDYGKFDNYVPKKRINIDMINSTSEFGSDCNDPRDFVYNKKQFTTRTIDDVADLFDVNQVLPQEIEKDWFDTEPLLSTKKIRGTHLIHPKEHMGMIQGSNRNMTHDIRGDIPNPKNNVSPWNMSTIEPTMNTRGIC